MKSQDAFTLIELVIVLLIIAIIGGVIANAFALKDRKEAFMASCLEHEQRYSCEHKWKQMHPDPQTVFVVGGTR